jgi:hypothetical protein
VSQPHGDHLGATSAIIAHVRIQFYETIKMRPESGGPHGGEIVESLSLP